MNIGLVSDKLLVEGMALSASERVALEETLREPLTLELNERAVTHVLPEGRNARREQRQVSMSGNMGGAGLGKSLGVSLGSHVWDGQTPQSGGQGGRR